MRLFTNTATSLIVCGVLLAMLAAPAAGADAPNGDRDVLRSISRAVSQLAADVRPAVVSVYTTKTVKMMGFREMPSPFKDFFGPGGHRQPPPQRERSFRRRWLSP